MKWNTKYHLPAVLWAIIILALTSYPRLQVPELDFNQSDKLAHFIVYFILAVLTFRAFLQGRLAQFKDLITMIIIVTLFGAFDELHQIPIPGRSGDLLDLLADVLGIISGGLLYYWIISVMQKRLNKEDSYA